MPEHTDRGAGGGGGDVHSRMSATGGTREELDITYTPDREVSTMDRAKDQAQETMNQAKDQAQDLAAQAKQRAQEMSGRASDAMSRAKDKIEEMDAMGTVRDHPLPALGAAFAVGFLLAGSGSHRDQKKHGALSMVRRQVRSAVMGGVSAAIAHEARSMMGMQGGSGGGSLLSSLFGGPQSGSSQGQGNNRSRSSGSSSQGSQTQQPQQHYH